MNKLLHRSSFFKLNCLIKQLNYKPMFLIQKKTSK